MIVQIVVAAAIAAVTLFFWTRMGADVSGAEARARVAAGARLIDVRTEAEFAAGHIPGAINLPVHALETRLGEVGPKQGEVVVYCRSGARSGRAARALRAAGYTAVRDLGAMSRW